RLLLAACAVSALIPGASAAQTLTTGAISGVVVDDSGRPLTEVLLALEDSAGGTSRSVTADREGRFHFSELRPGTYALTAERIGFTPRRLGSIDVRPEGKVFLTLELAAAGGDVVLTEERLRGGVTAPRGAAQWI